MKNTYKFSMFLHGTNHLISKFEFTGSINQCKRVRKEIAATNDAIYGHVGGVFITYRKAA